MASIRFKRHFYKSPHFYPTTPQEYKNAESSPYEPITRIRGKTAPGLLPVVSQQFPPPKGTTLL